ncbi:helix-turn-helix transcriptional regulator [Paenibacillus physcomitrellae]|uniref:DNA-binding transcriptional regulator n=1 Tax=Paenibacillus physcomitrellae TaxID=1619311 RepID=A0ABQ1FNK5_9BACL|nr:YafY family protein [Paenibacillus physcomitrellae]GGA23992.1 DNA-binding transcriptional regulator [Paenibacillus physcomitrellae]
MSKSKRLMELMLAVHRKRHFTVKELANEFGVSSRTILRDLQELGELGVPLYSEVGPHGGYRLLNERMLPPIAFSEEEAVAVFFASHALRHYRDIPFQTEISSALSKFYLHMPQDVRDKIDVMRDRVDFQVPQRPQKSPHLNLLLQAAIGQQVVRAEYDGRKGSEIREILPVGIYASGGLWYCPAYCFSRKDYRLFRCDRITAAEILDGPEFEFLKAGHEIPKTGQVDLKNWGSVHHANSEFVDIYVELSREGCRRCESELWPLLKIYTRADGSGWIDGRILKTDIRFFTNYFLGLGLDAKVTQPEELVTAIRRQLTAVQEVYRQEDKG